MTDPSLHDLEVQQAAYVESQWNGMERDGTPAW